MNRKIIKKTIAVTTLTAFLGCNTLAVAAPLSLAQTPLFLASNTPPNVMVLYGNSNSMDEQADGQAVGSANSNSKSEITRNAVKNLISNYQGKINMGLMAYAQNNIALNDLSNSPYDASYNPNNYNPNWTGSRTSSTNKKFRIVNPSNTNNYIYYNVALPSYGPVQSNKANDTLFCFTTDTRSKAFSNGEKIVNNNINDPSSGPWLSYNCYGSKTNTVDAGPTSSSANNPAPTSNASTAGYSSSMGSYSFYPTDSDLAQGITNYGNQIAQSYVSPAWFSNTSPGYGYVHVPIAALTSTQATKLNTKLGTSQFTTSNTQTNAAYPLVNAGLTPLAGAVNTASRYFGGTLSSSTQGGPLPAPPNACNQNFLLMLTDGLPSVLSNGNISYDTNALLTDLTTSVSNIKKNQNVTSYVVGFSLPYGVSISQLNNIAQAGGTNTPYYANDPATLSTALNNVFSDIISRTSAASSVALNSGYISNGDTVYQARFNSGDWSGDLLAIPLGAGGSLPSDLVNSAKWRSAVQVESQSQNPTNRVILTTKSSTGLGIPFRWPANAASPSTSELDVNQTNYLSTNPTTSSSDSNGSLRLNYLRGDQSQEGTLFRKRSTTTLGDIVDSAPILIKTPQANYTTSDYITFKNNYANRQQVIYVGSNDGMLHAINASNGQEMFGYVPNAVFSKLNQLTSLNYSHQYYVDGSPNYADVQYSDGSWHTVLVSGMGNGAPGIFALDVTDPSKFTEANASSIVKFEYTNVNNADIGYIQQPPSIVKLNTGKWAAIFGNGWNNSGTGQASLFVVDIETGALITEISTGVGNTTTPNGLSNPTPVSVNGNGTVDYVYAGDLYGNMWKFDLSNSNSNKWGVALGGSPLFSTPGTQPITEQPEVTVSPNGGYMVLFGTGQYLQNYDISTTSTQAFYGIWDNNPTATIKLNQLQQQTITSTGSYRNVTGSAVDYSKKQGWYMNLPSPGERSVTNPVLTGGYVYFSTLTPSTSACSYGGASWLMTVDYLNGLQPTKPMYDTNGDGKINSSDSIVAGVGLSGIASSPTILKGLGSTNSPIQELFFNLSTGGIANVYSSGGNSSSRRLSWANLRQM